MHCELTRLQLFSCCWFLVLWAKFRCDIQNCHFGCMYFKQFWHFFATDNFHLARDSAWILIKRQVMHMNSTSYTLLNGKPDMFVVGFSCRTIHSSWINDSTIILHLNSNDRLELMNGSSISYSQFLSMKVRHWFFRLHKCLTCYISGTDKYSILQSYTESPTIVRVHRPFQE